MKKKKLAYGGKPIDIKTPEEMQMDWGRSLQIANMESSLAAEPWQMAGGLMQQVGMSLVGQGLSHTMSKKDLIAKKGMTAEKADKALKRTNLLNKGFSMAGGLESVMGSMFANGGTVGNVPVEIESDEVGELPSGQLFEAQGPSHEQGGIQTSLPAGTEMYSKRIKVDGVTMADRKKKRKKQEVTLEKLIESNNDLLTKNSLKRTKQVNQLEEEADTKIQDFVGQQIQQNEDVQQFAMGGPIKRNGPLKDYMTVANEFTGGIEGGKPNAPDGYVKLKVIGKKKNINSKTGLSTFVIEEKLVPKNSKVLSRLKRNADGDYIFNTNYRNRQQYKQGVKDDYMGDSVLNAVAKTSTYRDYIESKDERDATSFGRKNTKKIPVYTQSVFGGEPTISKYITVGKDYLQDALYDDAHFSFTMDSDYYYDIEKAEMKRLGLEKLQNGFRFLPKTKNTENKQVQKNNLKVSNSNTVNQNSTYPTNNVQQELINSINSTIQLKGESKVPNVTVTGKTMQNTGGAKTQGYTPKMSVPKNSTPKTYSRGYGDYWNQIRKEIAPILGKDENQVSVKDFEVLFGGKTRLETDGIFGKHHLNLFNSKYNQIKDAFDKSKSSPGTPVQQSTYNLPKNFKGLPIEEIEAVLNGGKKSITQDTGLPSLATQPFNGSSPESSNNIGIIENQEKGFWGQLGDWALSSLKGFSPGDALGMYGAMKGYQDQMANTLAQREGDTPNINAFEHYGEDTLESINSLKDNINRNKELSLLELLRGHNASQSRMRNSARGINTLRALDLAGEAQYAKGIQDITQSSDNALTNVFGIEAQYENNRDMYQMQGEKERDLADRMDRDNFYTQWGTNLKDRANAYQAMAGYINTAKQNVENLEYMDWYKKYLEAIGKGKGALDVQVGNNRKSGK